MSIWNSSSLTASDNDNTRGFKKAPIRISKQHFAEHKMFGKKRGKTGKSLLIGRKFKKKGKGIMHGSVSAKMPKSSGISPNVDEFDEMMAKAVGSSKSSKKKSLFQRKSFD